MPTSTVDEDDEEEGELVSFIPSSKSEKTVDESLTPPVASKTSRIVEASPNSPTITFKLNVPRVSAAVKESVPAIVVDKENESIASNNVQEEDVLKNRRKSNRRKSMLVF